MDAAVPADGAAQMAAALGIESKSIGDQIGEMSDATTVPCRKR